MDNFIVIAVVGLIVGLASAYIYKEKKKGVQCIGCPHSRTCSRNKAKGEGMGAHSCTGSCQNCTACRH